MMELTITDVKRSLITSKRVREFNFGEIFFACDLCEVVALGNNKFRRGSETFSMHPFSTLPVLREDECTWTQRAEDVILDLRIELEAALIKQKELQELVDHYQQPKRSAKQKELDAVALKRFLDLPDDTILKG